MADGLEAGHVTGALCVKPYKERCLGCGLQMIDGTEVLVITVAGAASPKAVLLLFHGCSHSAIDWWHASKNCPMCLGALSFLLPNSACKHRCLTPEPLHEPCLMRSGIIAALATYFPTAAAY